MTATLLPPNATRLETALASAIARISDVPVPLADLWVPDRCPAPLLPWLAWALSVDDWSPDWPEAQQRAVIAASVDIHRHKGSMWSVRRALEVMGYGDCDITEGWQTMVGGPWVVGNDPAPMRDLLAGSGGLAVEIERASTATCFDATGAMVLCAPNTPRLDHDPVTGAPRGLLIEGETTNYVLGSADLSVAPWGSNAGVTRTGGQPDAFGGTAATRVVFSGASLISCSQWIAAVSSGLMTCSAFIKGTAGQTIRCRMGSPSEFTHVLTGGWDLLSRTFAVTAGAAAQINISTWAGATARDVMICLPQAEYGATRSSYIPTGAAPATRSADQLVLPARLGTRDVTITTAAGGLDLPGADMDGDLRPALAVPAHLQRIETSPAPGAQPIPVPVGGAGHWAEYWVTVRAPVTPAMVEAIARRLASVAPVRCRLTHVNVDAVRVVVGGPWAVGDETVTVGATYPTSEIL